MQYLLIILLIIGIIAWLLPYAGYITGIVGIISIFAAMIKAHNLKEKYPNDEAIKAATDKITNSEKQCQQQQEKMAQEEREHRAKIEDLQKEYQRRTKELQVELNLLAKESIAGYSQVFVDTTVLSEEYKNQLSMVQIKQTELIKADDAVQRISAGSPTKKADNNNVKQLLRCFNSECEIIVAAVTTKNVDAMRTKIQRSYEQLNKIFETDGVALTHKFLELKQQELVLAHSFQVKKEQEREEQKAIREQILEEEKVLKEIEREKVKIEKEETQFKSEIDKLMKYLQKASEIEKQLYVDKIKELEDKLKLLAIDKENVFQREQNTRAGFVYIISNIGSFGEEVYKIGMTRRLEPLDRVKELSDASVPFEFDVHAMIFSEDAPGLENILHQTFRNYEVNKVNHRKEFFKVPLREVEQVVKDNYNATVTFTEVALAEEYRQSLAMQSEALPA